MALIRCKECGKEISDKLKACIHCGTPISEMNKNNIESGDGSSNLRKYVRKDSIIKKIVTCGIVLVICITLGIVFSLVKDNKKIEFSDEEKQIISILNEMKAFLIVNPGGQTNDIDDITINNLFYVQNKDKVTTLIGVDWSMKWNGELVNLKFGLFPDKNSPNYIDEECFKSIYGEPETAATVLYYSYELTMNLKDTGEFSDNGLIFNQVSEEKIKKIETVINKKSDYKEYTRRWDEIKSANKGDETSTKVEDTKIEEYQYDYHTLYTHDDGRYVSIRFLENGLCSTDFSNFNYSTNPSGVMRYTIKYVSNSCTYQKISERKLKIFDNTLISRTATSGGKTVNMGTAIVSSSYITVEFDEKYETLKITNGKFIHNGDPAFLTFIENNNENKDSEKENNTTEDLKQENSNNNTSNSSTNNNNNSSNNNNNSNNSNTTKPSLEELSRQSKEKLDKATVELKHSYSDNYEVKVNAPGFDYSNILTIKINNYEYDLYDTIQFEYKNIGNNCIEVMLIDQYNNTRTFNKCINFSPETPNYAAWIYDLAPSGVCTMMLKNLSSCYDCAYNSNDLTCTFDTGKTFSCTSFTMPFKTSGTLTITNKFGLSQTIPIECKK